MSALLEAASLSKTFFSEHNALPAVCNVSFSVAPGECLGLAGASGCGKRTLARLLMGLTPADSGTVSFNGQPLDFADAALHGRYRRAADAAGIEFHAVFGGLFDLGHLVHEHFQL